MSQTKVLVDALKKALKIHGKTYADVAQALQLSTTSVKRLFADEALSLKRLDAICAMMDLEITDLLQQVAEKGWQLQQLEEAQESEIARDLPLLLVTVAVLNHLSIGEILSRFNIDEHLVIRKLAWLDRQGLIELLPKNRIKLKVSGNFAWRPDGPIQRFFQENISTEYFRTRFTDDGERLLVLNGMLTKSSLEQFHRRLERVAQEFEELVSDDQRQPAHSRAGQTVVLAVRPWGFGVFNEFSSKVDSTSHGARKL